MAVGDAPIQYVMTIVDTELASAVETVAGAISGGITPIVAACFSIYMILITVNYARGAATEPVWDFWIRMASFAVVISLGLNMSNYTGYVVPIVTQTGNSLAALASGGTDTSAAQLDNLAIHYIKVIEADYQRISNMGIGSGTDKFIQPILWAVKSMIIIIGLVPFLIIAAGMLVIAKVGAVMIAAVGPIFFACLLFPATRQYFSAWVNTAFSYALIPVFVAVIAMFSVRISEGAFEGDFEHMSFKVVFMALVVNLLLILLLRTCTTLAASLSAGGINANFNAGGLARSGRNALRSADKTVSAGAGKATNLVSAAIQHLLQNNIKAG